MEASKAKNETFHKALQSHPSGSTDTRGDLGVQWRVVDLTMGEYDHSLRVSNLALEALTQVVRWLGRPWELVSQTSETESVAISILKHLNGDLLGTTTTLVDLCAMLEVLVAIELKCLLGHLPQGRPPQGLGHQLQEALEQRVLLRLPPFLFSGVFSYQMQAPGKENGT